MPPTVLPVRPVASFVLRNAELAPGARMPKEFTDDGAGITPPHSKGAGTKTYLLTVYALSEPAPVPVPPEQVTDAALLAAIKGKVLASADLSVTYKRRPAGTPR